MKHLSIVIPEGNLILDTVVGTLNLFQMANAYSQRIGITKEDVYRIDLLSSNMEPIKCHRFFQIQPTSTFESIEKTDLIIITSIVGDMENTLVKNHDLIEWLKTKRLKYDAKIVSLCRSAFILAETGLLNNKSCATHWKVHDKFAKMYPKINLLPNRIVSEDNGIYSSGGAYSFLNMILYLIERFYGREVAIWCSKMAEIDFDRINQNQFSIFSGQKSHDDEEIKSVQTFIEKEYAGKLNVESLADKIAVSSRSLIRRFKKATNNTPFEYIQRVRMEAAKKSFESTAKNIGEVMFDVGYNDERAFRKTFKKITGLSPLAYRKKFNREIALA